MDTWESMKLHWDKHGPKNSILLRIILRKYPSSEEGIMNVGVTELKQKLELIRYSKAGTVKKERYDQDLSMAIAIIERLQDELNRNK